MDPGIVRCGSSAETSPKLSSASSLEGRSLEFPDAFDDENNGAKEVARSERSESKHVETLTIKELQ